ncbi:carboxylating nicotinate-nucleotide diphosphorylase [Planctomycetota bacterium]
MVLQAPDITSYQSLIEWARREDLGAADITSQVTIPADQNGKGLLVFREAGLLCGMPLVQEVLRQYDEQLKLKPTFEDGQKITSHATAAEISGPLRSLLAAERVLLNFLQRLSGIATTTAKYVEAATGTNARIYDTRKTTPGWRELEKYAVRCGGGCNHRLGLYDAVLIKDNHLRALGTGDLKEKLTQVVAGIHDRAEPIKFIEVEVDNPEQLEEVLGVKGVDMVLLDNMTVKQLTRAVKMRDEIHPDKKVVLEASGGITLETVAQIARTGIDRISVGALTHSVRSLDIGLDLQ